MKITGGQMLRATGRALKLHISEHERDVVYSALVLWLQDEAQNIMSFSRPERTLYSLFTLLCKRFGPSAYGNEKEKHTVKLEYHLANALNEFCARIVTDYPGAYVHREIMQLIDPCL